MAENRGRFQAGNQSAFRHGGRSSLKRWEDGAQHTERYERLKAEALTSYPWLAGQPVLLRQLLDKQADVEHYKDVIAANGREDRYGNPKAVVGWKDKAEAAVREILRLVEAARSNAGGALPGSIPRWALGQYRMAMEVRGDDPADLERLLAQRAKAIAGGTPPALLPATQAEAVRIGQARRAEFARIKAENPSLSPQDAAARVGLYVGYEGAVNE